MMSCVAQNCLFGMIVCGPLRHDGMLSAVCSDALGPCGSLSYRGTVDILRVRD